MVASAARRVRVFFRLVLVAGCYITRGLRPLRFTSLSAARKRFRPALPAGFFCANEKTMCWACSCSIMAMRNLKALLKKQSVSSLELVALLNSLRDDSEPRLRHDHFVRKVRKVLGDRAGQFKDTKTAGYVLPQREACLMVMSYGYKLQGAMLDLLLPSAKTN